jgi:hypothetical protein
MHQTVHQIQLVYQTGSDPSAAPGRLPGTGGWCLSVATGWKGGAPSIPGPCGRHSGCGGKKGTTAGLHFAPETSSPSGLDLVSLSAVCDVVDEDGILESCRIPRDTDPLAISRLPWHWLLFDTALTWTNLILASQRSRRAWGKRGSLTAAHKGSSANWPNPKNPERASLQSSQTSSCIHGIPSYAHGVL